jgi:hypothetical protein
MLFGGQCPPYIMPLPTRRVGIAHHRVRSKPSEPQILEGHWDFSMGGAVRAVPTKRYAGQTPGMPLISDFDI